MTKQEIVKLKKEFIIEFGKHVKELRKSQKMTQAELSEKCFAETRKIGSVERGEYDFSFSSIYIIAAGLGISINKLLCFDAAKVYASKFSRKTENGYINHL